MPWILPTMALMPSASWPISSLPSTLRRAVRSPAPLAICRTRAFSSRADFTTLRTMSHPMKPKEAIADIPRVNVEVCQNRILLAVDRGDLLLQQLGRFRSRGGVALRTGQVLVVREPEELGRGAMGGDLNG